jgi:hypothetical protein
MPNLENKNMGHEMRRSGYESFLRRRDYRGGSSPTFPGSGEPSTPYHLLYPGDPQLRRDYGRNENTVLDELTADSILHLMKRRKSIVEKLNS